MPGNTDQISLIQAIKAANKATRKRGFKLWFATQLFISQKKRGYVYLLHMYLRWVDDFIDDPRNSIWAKRTFITHQRDLMARKLHGENIKVTTQEEDYLLHFIIYLIKNNKLDFIDYLENTFKSFEMDTGRLENDGVFSKSELSEYLTLLNEAIFKISFLFIPTKKNHKEINGFIGNFFWYVLAIRDFKEDINAGFINISREDLNKYNLDNRNLLKDDRRFLWLKENYTRILELLEDELIVMSKMPFFVKVVWGLSYFNLVGEFQRVKVYDFKFGIEVKKEPVKEFKTIISSIYIGIQIFLKIFV